MMEVLLNRNGIYTKDDLTKKTGFQAPPFTAAFDII